MNVLRTSPISLLLLPLGLVLTLIPGQTPAQANHPPSAASRSVQPLPSLAPLVDSVKAAVVGIEVRAQGRTAHAGGTQQDPRDFFGRGPHGQGGQPPLRQGQGSGFIIDASGLVITNNHVIEGAVDIQVKLNDGRTFEGEILGRDPLTDIALLKLQGEVGELPVVRLGDSDAIQPGDWVMAIGNPYGLDFSVSAGIISAKARRIQANPYDDFLQTDAAINPGNSGGPLFNLRGEVVGINTAIYGARSMNGVVGGTGIGFAVPSNMAKALVPMLRKEGVVTRGYLGVGIQNLNTALAEALGLPVQEGAVVVSVSPDSPAAKAGVAQEDVVVALDGEPIPSGDALTRLVAMKRPGTEAKMTVYRGKQQRQLSITLGTRPDFENVAPGGRPGAGEDPDRVRQERLGLAVQDLDARMAQSLGMTPGGALISQVTPGSPAERAELMRGMVVVEANRRPVRNTRALDLILRRAKPGSTVLLRVRLPGNDGLFLRALRMP